MTSSERDLRIAAIVKTSSSLRCRGRDVGTVARHSDEPLCQSPDR